MIACIARLASGSEAGLLDRFTETVAQMDAGLVDTVFTILLPLMLLAALVVFDLLGLGMLVRDLSRANKAMDEVDQPDGDSRMQAADEIFVEGDRSGPLRPELRAAWSNAQVRSQDGRAPSAIKNIATAFGEAPVIQVGAHRRVAQMVPIYLLVLGLVGACLRLIIAMSRAEVTQTLTLGGALAPAIPPVGALLLVMLLCVILWYLIDRTLLNLAHQQLARLQHQLSARVPTLDESDLLELLLEDQKSVAKAMDTMGTEMPERFRRLLTDEFAPAMFESYRQSINEHLTPAIRSVVRTVEYFSDLNVKSQEEGMRLLADRFYKRLDALFMENMREMGEQTRGLLDLQERNSKMLETLQANTHAALLLQQNVNQETIDTARALEESRSRLGESTRLYDETLAKTGEIATILAHALDGDRQMIERLREEQAAMRDTTNGYLATVAEQVQKMMERFREEQKSRQEDNDGYLAGMAAQVKDLMDRFHTEQMTMQENNSAYLGAMGEQTGRLQEALSTLSEGYTTTMGEQTQRINEALQALGSNYMDTMNRQILQMQDDLHSAIQSIFARFTDINQTTFDNIEQQSASVLEQLSTTSKTVMEEMSDQVTDLGYFTREINAEVTALNDSLRQTVAQFGDRMRTTMESTFQSFDEGVAGLVERLSYTAEIIRDSVEDLPAAVVALRGSLTGATQTGPVGAGDPANPVPTAPQAPDPTPPVPQSPQTPSGTGWKPWSPGRG